MRPKDDRNIHVTKAKEWGVSAFKAEWFANAVKYCQSSAGRKQFREWLHHTYDDATVQRILNQCKPPNRSFRRRYTGEMDNWDRAARDLGVSLEALEIYMIFVSAEKCCTPKGTKPAPRRRKGESSRDYLVRRREAFLEGARRPNFNFYELKKIVVSEYDAVRDLAKRWRIDPLFCMESIVRRSHSTIPSQHLLVLEPAQLELHLCSDALKYSLQVHHLAHATWSRAAKLFEDLERAGLTSASAIERQFKKDDKLLWRIVGVYVMARVLCNKRRNNAFQAIIACDYYRPFFKAYRDQTGFWHAERSSNQPVSNLVDSLAIRLVTDRALLATQALQSALDESPEECVKFSAEAFEELGNLNIVEEFWTAFDDTPFGDALRQTADSAWKEGRKDHFFSEISFMKKDRLKIQPANNEADSLHHGRRICEAMSDAWLKFLGPFDLRQPLMKFILDPQVSHFDAIWQHIDGNFWEFAQELECEPGSVREALGLLDPNDPNKPDWHSMVIAMLEEEEERERENQTGNKSSLDITSVPAFQISLPGDTAKSGHAYLAEARTSQPHLKIKTRPQGTSEEETLEPACEQTEEGESDDELPQAEALPQAFKLGKKNMKIFHRILEAAEDSDEGLEKRGQIRWEHFERVMTRIGFDVVQTSGSAVRFDPPARNARPITFHRPHPDSTMTPMFLRWVGARLRRCYGWRVDTFQRSTEPDGDG